ncbi:MAG: TlpA family protein disulfide reductase [Gammaproteobacteria bacterium]|nr:MAG: TlpA family protein disulfide reductase [Gammaproteobacteria bacterium]
MVGISNLHAMEDLAQTLTPVEGRPPAPDFIVKDIEDNTHKLSDYRGQPVILNFWATWCPPCREEMPAMQRAWEKLRTENIALLAMDVGEDEDTIFTFTADYAVEFPLLMDIDSSIIQQWPVLGLPTTFVIDPEGRIVYRAVGGREWDDPVLLDQVRALKLKK